MAKSKRGAIKQCSRSNTESKEGRKKEEFRKMIKKSKPKRDRLGNITKAAEYQEKSKSGQVSRVDPNRKWFGNTRVISQNELQNFIQNTKAAKNDPYKVIIKPGKLPFSLLLDHKQKNKRNLLQIQSYEDTFGSKSLRKRPKLQYQTIDELAVYAKEKEDFISTIPSIEEDSSTPQDSCFKYGQSKRIWSELYKVVDSSDIIFQVIDARDPMGTRSHHIEKFIKDKKSFKHMILILNKCDLVPTSALKSWVYTLSKEYPTIAFRSGIQKSFGKAAVFHLLRQFSKFHLDKKSISVGLIGYPNVGKSSIINTLVGKKVCNVAPIPGETKVWQYISLIKRVFLIDSPGVVYPTSDSESEIIMKGVVRAEYIKDPSQYIGDILAKVKPEYLTRTYGVLNWTDSIDFLQKMSVKSGRLLKGGEPDIETVSKMIIMDFQRGKLPYFAKPPVIEDTNTQSENLKLTEQKLEEIEKTTEF